MKIFLLRKTVPSEFADFSHVGTWSEETEYCASCEYSNQQLIEPLQIEWEPGSDIVGDFSWCGAAILINEYVKEVFEKNGLECKYGKVEIKESTTPIRGRKIVGCPYTGLKLYWLIPNRIIDVDIERSELLGEKCKSMWSGRLFFLKKMA